LVRIQRRENAYYFCHGCVEDYRW